MPPPSPFRVAAPAALALAVAATLLLVLSAGGSHTGIESAVPSAATTTTRSEPSRRSYTVRRGDDLSTIASRFGLDVAALMEHNPDVDPQALAVGTRLRLRD